MWLTTWTEPGSPFPDYAEHATEADAIAAAKRKSLELGGIEVSWVPVRDEVQDEYAEASSGE